jgi:uncharacterized membrane protein YphA (DoxX/SURF4 family)
VGLAEVSAGLLLVLGLASGLGALLAALLSLHIQFSDANGPWLYEYAVEWVPLLCLVFMKSGLVWGLDSRIAVSSERWRRLFA